MVYLVPLDKAARPDYVIAMQNAILHVQAFYHEQTPNGYTFSVHTPVVEVYRTAHPTDFYSTGQNGDTFGFWRSVLDDGFSLTGGGFNDPDNRWIFYIDAPGGCGQLAGAGGAGVAVIAQHDLRGLTGQSNIPPCPGEPPDGRGVCRYVGGLAHELGHAFDLPHPPGCDQGNQTLCGNIEYNSLMYFGYSLFPNTYLLEQDRVSLMSTGFFAPFNLGTPGANFCSSMTAQSPNPIDRPSYFVRWNYKDFLTREPDESGAEFWTNPITQCGWDVGCVDAKRVHTSAAFFLSIEFQETGYLAYRTHKAAYGNLPGKPVPLGFSEFTADSRRIAQGVVVNAPGWRELLESNKQTYFDGFAGDPRFAVAYPQSMTPAQFVDALNANAGQVLSADERDALIGGLTDGTLTRARVLRAVAEDADTQRREFSRAFVLTQYFGYLRRDPDAAPDADFSGYNFWLGKLEEFDGNFVAAEMVKAFITSDEYRHRFGQ
jgi:hypothetical protein